MKKSWKSSDWSQSIERLTHHGFGLGALARLPIAPWDGGYMFSGKALTPAEAAVAAPDRFIAWCKQEQASIEQQLELMQSGKVRTGEDIGAGWIDTTEDSIGRARARLTELNELLTEAGTATVVRPSDL